MIPKKNLLKSIDFRQTGIKPKPNIKPAYLRQKFSHFVGITF